MTLCAAWIRQGNNDEGKELVFATDSRCQELVFATDSRLRGGEAWDYGLKLFDLGRSDCLLCFAGATRRAYPLVLQAMTAARTDVEWTNPRIDLYNIRDSLCSLFTRMCLEIADLPDGDDVHAVRSEAQFLFGGWSWREQQLKIWKLYYAAELQAFTHQSMTDGDDARTIIFLGDEVDMAELLMAEELQAANKVIRGSLDMEPVRVLARMARDTSQYHTIGGALQIGKVYRSGHNEFLGVLWPSVSDGRPHFMGKAINPYDAPPIRFIDPDTTALIEQLPAEFRDLEQFNFGAEARFIQDAYPDRRIKNNLPEAYRLRLTRIFRDTAYRQFVQAREAVPNRPAPAANSESAHD